MARSSRSADDENGRRRLQAGFVLLVGVSGGSIALQGGASPVGIVLATLGGLACGGALLWYLTWATMGRE